MPRVAKLIPKYKAFAQHWVKQLAENGKTNLTECAVVAGYSEKTARREGVRISKLQCVQDYISTISTKSTAVEEARESEAVDAMAKAREYVVAEIDRLHKELENSEMPPELVQRIEGMEVTHTKKETWRDEHGDISQEKETEDTRVYPPDIQAISVMMNHTASLRRQLAKMVEALRLIDGGDQKGSGNVNIYVEKMDLLL